MKVLGGSRIIAFIGVCLVLALAASTAVVAAQRLDLWWQSKQTPLPLGASIGDLRMNRLGADPDNAANVRVASDLGSGCKIFITASMCPALLEAIKELEGLRRLEVRGKWLPFYWLAREDSDETIAILARAAPENMLLVSDRVWQAMRPQFTPQFFLLDVKGVVIASGWPDPGFLRSLPDELQVGFEQRCESNEPAASRGEYSLRTSPSRDHEKG